MITRPPGPFSASSSRSSIGALLAMAIVALGCRDTAVPACSSGVPLSADLSSWSQAMERLQPAADGPAIYDAHLAELGLQPLPDRTGEAPAPEDGPMSLASVEITALQPGGGKTPDQLVAARFRSAAGAESLRAQLLRPLAGRENLYCPLGDELSHDAEIYEEPCLERHEGPARSLAATRLIALDRDSIVVRDAGGWCGPGTSRGDRLSTALWGIEDGRLVRYLEVITFEAWYESPAPPARTRHGEIALSDGLPRVVTVTEVVKCHPSAELATSDDDCEPFESTREYHYIDHRYVVSNESSPTSGNLADQPTEKATQ